MSGWASYLDQHRDEICEWIKANGLDPARIPESTVIHVSNGRILTSRIRMLGDDGNWSSGAIDVPLLVPPSPVVAAWLA